ncbi:hypothetical protein BUE80_DR002442, partial [Diplocarpon rosae]
RSVYRWVPGIELANHRNRQPRVLPHQNSNSCDYASDATRFDSAATTPGVPFAYTQGQKARALDLYIAYCDAVLKEKVENSEVESRPAISHRDGYHLSAPQPPTAQSVTSYTSSKCSLANSGYENVTDLSSVVSFDDEDEPNPAAAKVEGELMSFDGKKVRQRRRKKLDPVARAKAALIRHLCPLDHHDIYLLEKLRQQRLEAQRPRAGEDPGSSLSSSSQQKTTTLSTWQNTRPGVSQSNALMGVGTKLDLGQVSGNYTSQLDIQSPGEVAIGDILSDSPAPAVHLHVATDLPNFSPGPYASYQDGQMIAIGVHKNGHFYCQHLDGLCNEYFATDEQLQVHFETDHFAFTRIHPAHRLMCSSCSSLNYDMLSPCTNCFLFGALELWVYGNFIHISSYHRHAPDPQGIASITPDTLFSTISHSNIDLQWDQDPNSGNYGGYTDPGSYHVGDEGGGGSVFGGSQHDYQATNHSNYSTTYQGHKLNGARELAEEPVWIHILHGKARKSLQGYGHIVLRCVLLLHACALYLNHRFTPRQSPLRRRLSSQVTEDTKRSELILLATSFANNPTPLPISKSTKRPHSQWLPLSPLLSPSWARLYNSNPCKSFSYASSASMSDKFHINILLPYCLLAFRRSWLGTSADLVSLGSEELEALVDAYVVGNGSKQEKLSVVTVEFFNHATVDLKTGALARTYHVYDASMLEQCTLESQSSGFSSALFTPSPGSSATLADSGYGSFGMSTPSVTPPTRTLASASLTKKAKKRDHKARKPKVEETRLPGFSIMTKDGIDVTTTASRGTKTKEQREHAHLMRIMKACDTCKRKKTRCDPSHRRSHNDMSRTSSTKMTSSASAGPSLAYEGGSHAPISTRRSIQAPQNAPLIPSNTIDDFILFPEDAPWNPEMSQADLGQFNFEINGADLNLGLQFDVSLSEQQQAFAGNFGFDSQLVHSFSEGPYSSAGLQNFPSIAHTNDPYAISADKFDLDQYLAPNEYTPVHVRPHSAGQYQDSFQRSTTSLGPNCDFISSISDWSMLEPALHNFSGGIANLPSPMPSASGQTSSSRSEQRVSRSQRGVITRAQSTTIPASGCGSRPSTVVNPSDILDVPLASMQRPAPAVHLGGSSSFADRLCTLAQDCRKVSERIRAIKSSRSEYIALVKELQSLRFVATGLKTSGATASMSVHAEVQAYQAQLHDLSLRLGELEFSSASRPVANPLLNTLDPDFYPEFLRRCQVQARRLARSLCATINSTQAHNTGTHPTTNAETWTPGCELWLFSPSPSQKMQDASLGSGGMWVNRTIGWQASNGPSVGHPSSDSGRENDSAQNLQLLFTRPSKREELDRETSSMQAVSRSSLTVKEPRFVGPDQAGSSSKLAQPLTLTSHADALFVQSEQLGRNLAIQVSFTADCCQVPPASHTRLSHRDIRFTAAHASSSVQCVGTLRGQPSIEPSSSATPPTPTDNATGASDLTEPCSIVSSVIQLLPVIAALIVIGSLFMWSKYFTSNTPLVLSALAQAPDVLRGSCHAWVGTDSFVSVVNILPCAIIIAQSPSVFSRSDTARVGLAMLHLLTGAKEISSATKSRAKHSLSDGVEYA